MQVIIQVIIDYYNLFCLSSGFNKTFKFKGVGYKLLLEFFHNILLYMTCRLSKNCSLHRMVYFEYIGTYELNLIFGRFQFEWSVIPLDAGA